MHRQTEVHSVIHYQLYPPSGTLTNSQALETVFAGVPKGDQALIRGEGVAVRWGTLDVLDLLFTPFPQFLPELGIESLLVGKRDTCPSSEILKKKGVHYRRTTLESAGILTLPFSSAAVGAVPAYKELIAPYGIS